ncbi:hypothetical protein PHISCL_03979 [Aspergillus sclerotialis]|uniref:Uncharacterized protein n=1 Tax=Aspergillus sclerotialis TaxID=2070753 RepID=A0A3A2ZWK4_9EURO|nr:hypothetical protein PHISCL_03979 [Aspergillus sclerotialis]
MKLLLSPVDAEDVEMLVLKVEYPAHQDGPLSRVMFPSSSSEGEKTVQAERGNKMDDRRTL